MSKAYAYLRVSSKAQTNDDKDGLERQKASIRRMALQHNVDFDTIQIYEDKGVSSYTGRNAEVGELKELIDDIESLDIKSGDVIFVESIDRFSRQRLLKTKSLIYDKILSKGVKIITTSDGAIYQDHQDPNEVFKQDLMISLIAQRANEESRIKSVRRKSAWNKAKSDNSKPFNHYNPPYGIIYNKENNRFEIDEDKQKELIEIFTLLQDFGIKETMNRINKVDHYRNWTNKLITNLFETKYVLGFYKSQKRENGKKVFIEFIEDYYPQIVTNVLFDQAKNAMTERKTNKNYGVRTKGSLNIFRHCIKCNNCGSTMIFEKQINSNNKIFYYYQCQSNREVLNSCVQRRFRFDYAFAVVFRTIKNALNDYYFVKKRPNEFDEKVHLETQEVFERTNELFSSLFTKDQKVILNNEIDELKEELSKKEHKYKILENQLIAFMDDESSELDPLFVKKLSLIKKEINELRYRLNILEVKSRQYDDGIRLYSAIDFLELFKTEKGRIKINNYFTRNNIILKVKTYKNILKYTYLEISYYKDGKYYTKYTLAFKTKQPLLAYFPDDEFKDITDII